MEQLHFRPLKRKGHYKHVQILQTRLESAGTTSECSYVALLGILVLFLAPGSSIGGAASGASSIPMVHHSNGLSPHTDMDVRDALPWVGRARGHDVSIEMRWYKVF
jgi:hypothetical protein